MGVVRGATAARWALALGGSAVIGLLPTLVAARPATQATRTPRQLVAKALDSAHISHEGYVETSGALGLPDLPRLGQVAALLGGTTQARVWWRSPTAWRVDRVTATGESGTYAWHGALHTWDFESHRVQTVVSVSPIRLPRLDDLLPPQAARRILAGLTRDDRLSALPAKRVAGRSADGVRILPAATHTTVGRVDMYVDSATGLPLSLQLFARGSSNAALTSRFLDVRLTRPDRGVLTPRTPLDAPTDTVVIPDLASAVDVFAPFALPAHLGSFTRSRNLVTAGGSATYGEGFARFIVLPLSPDLGRSAVAAATAGRGVLQNMSGGSGVLVRSPLLNALIASSDDRMATPLPRRRRFYLVAGTVDTDTLTAAAKALFDNPPPSR